MVTSLTLYGTNTNTATTVLATPARGLVAVTGASSNGVPTTKIGTATGTGDVPSNGTTSAWPAGSHGVLPTPNGGDWLFDSTILEENQIVSGTWTAVVQTAQSVQTSASTMDLYVRVFKLAADLVTYTHIGDMSATGQTITTTLTQYTLTGSLSAVSFATGDKLYLQSVVDIQTNNTGSAGATLKWTNSNSATQGKANNMQIATPGYTASSTSTIVITNAGVNLFRNSLGNSDDDTITYVAFGTSNTAPTTADTALGAETYRIPVTSYANGSTGEILITGYLSPTALLNQNIAEVGFFGGLSASAVAGSGVLVGHGLYTVTNKTNLESFNAVLDLTFTQA